MKKYSVRFEFKDTPGLGGTLIYNDRMTFSLEEAERIVKEENDNPANAPYNHFVEEAA